MKLGIVYLIIIGVISYSVCLVLGCSPSNTSNTSGEIEKVKLNKKVISRTDYDLGYLLTVKHDGHLFVIEGRYQKGAILHHPDCPCKANKFEFRDVPTEEATKNAGF